MNILEKEIIEKFRQLPPESRLQMLSTLQEEVASQQVSLTAWLAEAEQVRIILRKTTSPSHSLRSVKKGVESRSEKGLA